METKVHEYIEAITSYLLAIAALFFSAVLANASAIMALGGLVLLCLRLYVDGVKAYKTWKGDV